MCIHGYVHTGMDTYQLKHTHTTTHTHNHTHTHTSSHFLVCCSIRPSTRGKKGGNRSLKNRSDATHPSMKPTAMMVGREFDQPLDPGQFGEEERRESERVRHEIAYDQDFESEGEGGYEDDAYNQNDFEDGGNSPGEPDVLQLNSDDDDDDDGGTQTGGEDEEWVDEGEWDQDDDKYVDDDVQQVMSCMMVHS
jgi:hypothetical protein